MLVDGTNIVGLFKRVAVTRAGKLLGLAYKEKEEGSPLADFEVNEGRVRFIHKKKKITQEIYSVVLVPKGGSEEGGEEEKDEDSNKKDEDEDDDDERPVELY